MIVQTVLKGENYEKPACYGILEGGIGPLRDKLAGGHTAI